MPQDLSNQLPKCGVSKARRIGERRGTSIGLQYGTHEESRRRVVQFQRGRFAALHLRGRQRTRYGLLPLLLVWVGAKSKDERGDRDEIEGYLMKNLNSIYASSAFATNFVLLVSNPPLCLHKTAPVHFMGLHF